MAWNFFKQAGKEDKLVGYTPLEPAHIEMMLEELQTDYIDILVIHTHDDSEKLRQEMDIAQRWMSERKVKRVGLGMVELHHLLQLPERHPITHILAPYNAFHQGAKELFIEAKKMGMTTIALSPFIRGWKLDEIGEEKGVAADHLLRWAVTQEQVDQVIVSMRKVEWVQANMRAADRGSLTVGEQLQLDGWVTRLG